MLNKFKLTIIIMFAFTLPILINGCLIEDVSQSSTVNINDTFSTTLTISDKTADTNPHEGAVDVLVPDDWTFDSGTYDFSGGSGNMIIDTSSVPVYGNVDSVLPPPTNMKWIFLLSDSAYTNASGVIYEVKLNFKVGQKTGDFPIGYLTTKNTADLLVLNPHNYDNDSAWTDTSMNHMVTVNDPTAVQNEKDNSTPTQFALKQNYPNPFNPETQINYALKNRSFVSLKVYNMSGQLIKDLVNRVQSAGYYHVRFSGLTLPSGVYLYQLTTNNFTAVKKMILLK